jgi:hypothetical protein
MKDITLLLLLSFLCIDLQSQVLIYTEPAFPTADDDVTIYFDTSIGNDTLAKNNGDIYAYTGVITDRSKSKEDWKYIVTNYKNNDTKNLLIEKENGLYTMKYNIRDYYDLPMAETVLQLAFELRDEDGKLIRPNKDELNFYTPIYDSNIDLTTQILLPASNLNPTLGDSINIIGIASQDADLTLYQNGNLLSSECGNQLNYILNAEKGYQLVAFIATNETSRNISYFSYHVADEENMVNKNDDKLNLTSSTGEDFLINKPKKELTFNLTPNPSDGDLSIYYQTNTDSPIQLNITDVVGKQMYEEVINGFPGLHSKSLEMDLEDGIYLVHLKMKEELITQKLIIQK